MKLLVHFYTVHNHWIVGGFNTLQDILFGGMHVEAKNA